MYILKVSANIGISECYEETVEIIDIKDLLTTLETWIQTSSGNLGEALQALSEDWDSCGGSIEKRESYACMRDLHSDDAGNGRIAIGVLENYEDDPILELVINYNDKYKTAKGCINYYYAEGFQPDDVGLVSSYLRKWEEFTLRFQDGPNNDIKDLTPQTYSSLIPCKIDFFKFKNKYPEIAAKCCLNESIQHTEDVFNALPTNALKNDIIEYTPILTLEYTSNYSETLSNIDLISYNNKHFNPISYYTATFGRHWLCILLSHRSTINTSYLNIWDANKGDFIGLHELPGYVYPEIHFSLKHSCFIGHLHDRLDKFFIVRLSETDISLSIRDSTDIGSPPSRFSSADRSGGRSDQAQLSEFFINEDEGTAYFNRPDVKACYTCTILHDSLIQ